ASSPAGFCCAAGQLVPLQPASYAARTNPAQCPNPVKNNIPYDIDGCSVIGAQVGIPALNVQDPTSFLYGPLLFNQASTSFGANIGGVPQSAPAQTLPCNRHDVCYQTCNSVQASCDAAFHTDMDAVCNTAYPA